VATTFATYKKYITPDVMPAPDVLIERELVNILIEFCALTHVITKDFDITLADHDDIDTDLQDSIDVDLTDYFTDYRPVALVRLNIDGVDYTPKYKDVVNNIDAWDSSIQGTSEKYYMFYSNTVLRLWNMSSGDTYCYIRMALKPTRDITTVQDEFLYEDHITTIAAGVVARILAMPGKAWTDEKAAGRAYWEWRRGVSKARSNFDRNYTRDPAEVYPRSFGGID